MSDVELEGAPLIPQNRKIYLSNKEIEEVQKRFNDFIDTITVDNTSAKLKEFNGILKDRKIEEMEACYKQEEKNLQNVQAHLPDQKCFLTRFSLQEVLVRMLKDIAKYREFLELFIDRFKAHKERIEAKHLLKNDTVLRPKLKNDPRTMQELDTPLHCAVKQLNVGFLEWLLEKPAPEVNLRNIRRETALAILCTMYDWSKEIAPTLKPRLKDIEKEREKADKMQQIWLDDEKLELVALKKQLKKTPTILELIKKLLDKGADFNIYMNDGALPFDFLRKYYTKAVLDDVINLHAKSNVTMTDKAQKQLNASTEGKNVSKMRIVKFYMKTEDMDVRVTVELLEIFIRFNDLEKFKQYWKDFTVTSDNVKKVITLLLHVAVKLNYTTFVDHIIKKASKEIFKLEENKATETQEPTRSVNSERNHIFWCCSKCCQKRHYLDSQTQSEATDLPVITPNSQDKYETISERQPTSAGRRNQKNPSSSEGFDSQTQGETFKQEKHETENSEDTRAGTSKKLSMNAEGSFKENPFATEGTEPQTQSRTSKLQVTDPHTERATSNPEDTVPQTQSETIESQDNQPDSQNNREVTTPRKPTSDEQPCRWCCFKCCQKRHNPEPTPMSDEPTSWWRCFKMFQKKQKHSPPNTSTAKENKLAHHAELKGLLKTVCENGNNALLKLLLSRINDSKLLNEHPLLILTIQKMSKMKENEEIKYFQDCATTLIENHGKICMQDTDPNKNTALHLALQYKNYKIASLLLKEGHGLMGLMNKQNLTPIEYGTTKFWNNYLDNCITIKDKTELRFNVGFLGPLAKEESTYVKPSKASKVSTSHFKFRKLVAEMNETHNTKYRFTRTVNDMTALRLISQSPDRKEFLMHPVIIAFITMKWKRLFHWHILNLLLTTITMGTFMAYTLMPCPSGGWYGVMAGVGAFIISVREIMQMFLLGWSYFRLENVVDITNVGFIFKVLECGCQRDGMCEYVPIFSSFVYVSLALQATFLLGATWNNLSITLYMFKTVSSSFFYSFLSFTPVIVAFVCSFYRMNNDGISSNNGTENNSSEEKFNSFHSSWDAAIKTLVMTTGEFEAANINYDGGRWLLFVAFLFIAPIVILNLINGLAVSDIADIRKESEFISVYKKVRMLERYERAIVESRFAMPGFLQWLFREPLFPSPFFEKFESIIYVIVNEENKLAISKKKEKSTKEANEIKASNNKKPPVIQKDPELKNDPSTSNNNDTGNDPGEESTPTDKKTTPSKGNAKIASNDLQLIPVFPWLPSFWLKYYIGTRWFQWTPYMQLDQSYVDKAKSIKRSQSKNNSKQTDELALIKITLTMHKKTLSLFRSTARLSKTNSQDEQIKKLKGQMQSITQILSDI